MATERPFTGEPLSPREQEILAALGDWLSNAEIADRFVLSVRTVESHVSALLRKTGAADRRELARLARVRGDRTPLPPALNSSHRQNLRGAPVWATSFVGRVAASVQLAQTLVAGRLTTLVGLGGIGKTRLAVRVGEQVSARLAAGGWFVDLSPVQTDFVPSAVATAIGVREDSTSSLTDAIVGGLAVSDGLLVLDNAEHVLDAVGELVDRLLAAAPALTILVTSREPLGLPGERVMRLDALDIADEATALFVDRASADDRWDGEYDPARIEDICRRLDGMPLAVELVAARAASLGLDGLQTALDDQLALVSGGRQVVQRHRSLRAVLDWSVALLDDEDDRTLCRLSLVAGFVTVGEAAALLGRTSATTAALLGRLTSKCLLVRTSTPRVATTSGPSVESRWRLLDTVRAYALDRLEQSADAEGARSSYYSWITGLAETLDPRSPSWPASFDWRAEDLRAAADWADSARPDGRYRLGMRLGWLLYARRFFGEAQQRYCAAAEYATGRASAQALLRAAEVAQARLRGPDWLALYRRAGVAAREAGDHAAAAGCFASAATGIVRYVGEFGPNAPSDGPGLLAAAEAELVQAAEDEVATATVRLARAWMLDIAKRGAVADDVQQAAQRVGDPVLLLAALDLATTTAMPHDLRRAHELTQQRAAVVDRLDPFDPRAGGEALDALFMAADVAIMAGQLHDGLSAAERMRDSDIGTGVAHLTLRSVVLAYALVGRLREALSSAAVMLAVWERDDEPPAGYLAPAVEAAGMAAILVGRQDDASRLFAISERISPAAAGFRAFVRTRVALFRGDPAAALAEFRSRDTSASWNTYRAYATAVAAEAAMLCHDPDADGLLADATVLADANAWARAGMQRARARAEADDHGLIAAADAFTAAGAEVEALLTRAMCAGGVGEQARQRLRELGVPV